MTDKFRGGPSAGGVSISLGCTLRKTLDSTEQTGKVFSDFSLSYWRQGGLRTAVTPIPLAAVDSAYAAGGVKEVHAAEMPGVYRIDWPDAAFATGADWVSLAARVAGCYLWESTLPLSPLLYPVNVRQINDDTNALLALFRSLQGYILGQAAAGTLTTLEFTSTLSAYADDFLFNKQGVFVTGALAGAGFRVRQSKQTAGRLIVTQLPAAPVANDWFVLY